MTFSNTDSENLARIAKALGRMAAADERRNDILEREMVERKAAWSESEERSNAALERLLDSEPTLRVVNGGRCAAQYQHGPGQPWVQCALAPHAPDIDHVWGDDNQVTPDRPFA